MKCSNCCCVFGNHKKPRNSNRVSLLGGSPTNLPEVSLAPFPLATASVLTNTNFTGTYSYVAINSSGSDYDNLAKPLVDRLGINRVYFGGEATNKYHPATVAGAYQSGLREATAIHASVGSPPPAILTLMCSPCSAFYPPSLARYDTPLATTHADMELNERRRQNARLLRSETEAKKLAGQIRRRGLRNIGSGNINHKFKYVSLFRSNDSALASAGDAATPIDLSNGSDGPYVNYNSLLVYVMASSWG